MQGFYYGIIKSETGSDIFRSRMQVSVCLWHVDSTAHKRDDAGQVDNRLDTQVELVEAI